MNVDEHTLNAIEIVSEGTKLTSQLLLYLMKSVVNIFEKKAEKIVIDGSHKEGKQKINDLLKKHKARIETIDGNLTKEELRDYQREFKKLGVDFSVVKNGKDSYSFFFASEHANVIEKGLRNVLELKSRVKDNKEVQEAELQLNAEKHKLSEGEIKKTKNIYDSSSVYIILSTEDKKKILDDVNKLGFGQKYDSLVAFDEGNINEIHLKNKRNNSLGNGDLKIEVDKYTGKVTIYEKVGETRDKSEYLMKQKNIDVSINIEDKKKVLEYPDISELSESEKALFNKMKARDEIAKKVESEIKVELQISIPNELSRTDKGPTTEMKTTEPNNSEIKTKEEAKSILHEKLSKLDDKELDLFVQYKTYENEVEPPKYNLSKGYAEADKVTEMQKSFPNDLAKEIKFLDSGIKTPIEVNNSKKLTTKEILNEAKKHQMERQKQKESVNTKAFSIEALKNKIEEIKGKTDKKAVIKKEEQSL
ncbi:PcfB family protein [Alkalihalobacillus sp. LMS39]|uniref:PcfB family protein n=1 Tax=Alkalihalobacillus sp. LMS39 TaxID=2924032 RepID=UPI001FB1B69B|nr:PcfB family protein [Alkalihalobacillus sp. LMS39]UOE94771.1 PcfB family protein [Alkalihalobacillus sp. LMS39]